MDPNWAADNLQVIRTLMERSALYRRALAPVMTFAGVIGITASVIGIIQQGETFQSFALLWVVAAVIAVIGVTLLIRRQALKDVEPFWTPPTRRVFQAVLPPLLIGLLLSLPVLCDWEHRFHAVYLVPFWLWLYGCALCAAGSFMPRGIKLFGWAFVGIGTVFFFSVPSLRTLRMTDLHMAMGAAFGVAHVLYGGYLFLSEKQRNKAA